MGVVRNGTVLSGSSVVIEGRDDRSNGRDGRAPWGIRAGGALKTVPFWTEPFWLSFNELGKPTKVPEKTDWRYGLAARPQYGAGLRLLELVRLGIKDVDRVKGLRPTRLSRKRFSRGDAETRSDF